MSSQMVTGSCQPACPAEMKISKEACGNPSGKHRREAVPGDPAEVNLLPGRIYEVGAQRAWGGAMGRIQQRSGEEHAPKAAHPIACTPLAAETGNIPSATQYLFVFNLPLLLTAPALEVQLSRAPPRAGGEAAGSRKLHPSVISINCVCASYILRQACQLVCEI